MAIFLGVIAFAHLSDLEAKQLCNETILKIDQPTFLKSNRSRIIEIEKGTLWWRTSSREKRSLSLYKLLQSIVLDPAAAAQILGWGTEGKNSGILGF